MYLAFTVGTVSCVAGYLRCKRFFLRHPVTEKPEHQFNDRITLIIHAETVYAQS
jgi:hypothetical protein